MPHKSAATDTGVSTVGKLGNAEFFPNHVYFWQHKCNYVVNVNYLILLPSNLVKYERLINVPEKEVHKFWI